MYDKIKYSEKVIKNPRIVGVQATWCNARVN